MDKSVTIMKLKSEYSNHAVEVLKSSGFIEDDPTRKRGAPRRFIVKKSLPTLWEYSDLQKKRYTVSLASLVEDAKSEIDCLRDELQDWYDNMPENFQNGDKGSALDEAIGTLDNISIDDLSCEAAERTVLFLPMLKVASRRDRADEAAARLRAVSESLREMAEGKEEEDEADSTVTDIECLADDLDNAADELDAIEFPGMY